MRKIILFSVLFCVISGTCAHLNASALKDWTVLIYVNGNNSLDVFSDLSINEMEHYGSTDKVNVVVQWGSDINPDTRRLYILQDQDPDNVTSPILQTLPVLDMGNSKNFVDFVVWGAKHFPAKHYLVTVWGHGDGWHFNPTKNTEKNPSAPASAAPVRVKEISLDSYSGHAFSPMDLGNAMYEIASQVGQKIDILATDACMMSMPEITMEMRKAVDFYVGSEETIPARSFPYDQVFSGINALGENSPENVSKLLVSTYVQAYLPGGEHYHIGRYTGTSDGVTLSAFDLQSPSHLILLADVKNLATAIMQLNDSQKALVTTAIQNTRTFDDDDFGDLIDFLDQLQALGVDSPTLREAAMGIRQDLANLIIAHQETLDHARAHGLSIWLPRYEEDLSRYDQSYQKLDFEFVTQWGAMLKSLKLPPSRPKTKTPLPTLITP